MEGEEADDDALFRDRRTYGATLAELTSLEELMRTVMGENMVHTDVVNKLWQVYSASPTFSSFNYQPSPWRWSWLRMVSFWVGTEQEIPKAQRQGAIIILGMLALAKKEVVTEKVDKLLKIGLGPLGMVSRNQN